MIGELFGWFGATEDIPQQILRHLQLAYVPVVAALLVALPVGLFIGHSRRFEFIAVTLANLGRAIPSFAILSLALIVSIRIGLGLGFWPVFTALFFLSLPPVLVNTCTGVKNVDPDTVEAARGQGMAERQVLRQIELPLAAPLIVGGIRTAAVQSVATATLGALVAAGGLGDYIVFGFSAGEDVTLLGGAVLVALVAIGTEIAFVLVERVARPRTDTSGSDKIAPIEHLAQTRRPGPEALGRIT